MQTRHKRERKSTMDLGGEGYFATCGRLLRRSRPAPATAKMAAEFYRETRAEKMRGSRQRSSDCREMPAGRSRASARRRAHTNTAPAANDASSQIQPCSKRDLEHCREDSSNATPYRRDSRGDLSRPHNGTSKKPRSRGIKLSRAPAIMPPARMLSSIFRPTRVLIARC